MLKVKSFSITDSDGVNELLDQHRLAEGAHILVSDGNILIPYEDGTQPNANQRKTAIGEDKNKLFKEIGIIEHSNRVMAYLIADATSRAEVAHANWDSARSDKKLEIKKDETKLGLDQLTNQKLMNEYEIIRLQRNIDEFDVMLKEISG